MIRVVVAISCLIIASQLHSQEIWHTDPDLAIKAAKENRKNILMVFTGSKWIDICKKFDQNILSQPDFYHPVSQHYELLKLEFPNQENKNAVLPASYQRLQNAYQVRGFPTVMVTDENGLPFGMNGYQKIPAANYANNMLAMLKVRKARDVAISDAELQSGQAKAKTLASAIPDLPGTLSVRFYRKIMEQVITLDPTNLSDRTYEFKAKLADVNYSARMQRLAASKKYPEMLKLTDRYISIYQLKGPLLQRALLNKMGVQQQLNDHAGSINTLEKVINIDPETIYAVNAKKTLSRLSSGQNKDKLEE